LHFRHSDSVSKNFPKHNSVGFIPDVIIDGSITTGESIFISSLTSTVSVFADSVSFFLIPHLLTLRE